jgi:nondiscriminating aspartyl-tRNA synthetase
MLRILTSELASHAGERVLVAGWLHHRRQLSRVTFVVLRDARGLAQIVVESAHDRAAVADLLLETVLEVTGDVVTAPQAPSGVELRSPAVSVIATPAEVPPIELRRPELKEQLPMILDHAPVALRHPRERAKHEIAAASLAGYRTALGRLGFTEIQTPKLVATATEGGANVFEVDYFGRTAYLAQSPQLYKQMMVAVFERVFETGPAFRAEPHDTTRHLAEYVSLDAEIGFIVGHGDVMAIAREAVAGMVEGVHLGAAGALELLGLKTPEVPAEVPAVDFVAAQTLIEEATGEKVLGELDLAPSHERWLGDWALREYDSEFVFVVGYPMAKRPFYTHPDPDRPEFSKSFDLLFRGLELMTGGQRLHLYEDYVAALDARGLSPDSFKAYLQAFRYAMPPHGGFAVGLERWVARLVGAQNIRETTLFPRDRMRLSP